MAMTKVYQLPCPHVFNNAHPGSWRVHAEFQLFLSQFLAVMPTHILMKQNIYLSVFIDITPSVQALYRISFLALFSLYTSMEEGVARRDSACTTPNVKLFMHTIY